MMMMISERACAKSKQFNILTIKIATESFEQQNIYNDFKKKRRTTKDRCKHRWTDRERVRDEER